MTDGRTTATGRESVSRSIVEAVASAEGVDPADLATPLYDAVDPDALDRLFAPAKRTGRVDGEIAFRYAGYEVTASADGVVSVEAAGAGTGDV